VSYHCRANTFLVLSFIDPVVPDGFGIGYIIKDNSIHYSISSKHRQTRRYASTLESVLKELASMLNPLSSVHIPSARSSLKLINMTMIAYDTYGYIWGESKPPPSKPPSAPNSPTLTRATVELPNHPAPEEPDDKWDAEGAIKPIALADETSRARRRERKEKGEHQHRRSISNDAMPVVSLE
jgi:hypothetical protein